jgi:hypothetical protein
MQFEELRNQVEHVAAAVAQGIRSRESTSDEQAAQIAEAAILAAGQCLVSIADSLDKIAKVCEAFEFAKHEPGEGLLTSLTPLPGTIGEAG